MKKSKHIGSSFESFLEEAGILEEVNAAAVKTVIARNLKEHMKKKHLTQDEMAKQLGTSRSGLKRLMDPKNYSVTLLTLNKAAAVIGKKIDMSLSSISKSK
jgi:predicted XRE-type DNA-binding protein